ncbi:MAG: glycosyltransferase, partial [Patescibacteria group bacterium]
EAGACAKPVIGSDLPGVRTVIDDGQTGFLVQPGDAADLVSKLEKILADGELAKRLGQAGREKVVAKYNWGNIAKEIEIIYKQIKN